MAVPFPRMEKSVVGVRHSVSVLHVCSLGYVRPSSGNVEYIADTQVWCSAVNWELEKEM